MGSRILQAMALAMLFHGGLAVAAERTAAPADARLYFISPADGETVRSPFKVRFGAQGIGVAPAGVGAEATGHHHLIIDGTLPAMDQPIPSNETYRHFGGGQTEAVIELEPGEHTLQLLMGDRNHVPHRPVVASPRITINVE
ncbi:MAG: DUF4399 domain-containing protein [Halofilum sp. (in: g-proteobacteria)]|nr:DUF4399 domain-containing protein [Halofilum sp. (in: g-proteobacteria)]